LTFAPRWAIWGFLIPLVNLVLPCQLVHEVWAATCEPERRAARPVLGWWLPFWGCQALGSAAVVTMAVASGPAGWMAAVGLKGAGAVLGMVSAWFAIRIIKDVEGYSDDETWES
jgi:hypothetical protein